MRQLKVVLVTLLVAWLVAALAFVVWNTQETKEVKDLKAKIHDFTIFKAEQQLELDILKIQKELAGLRGPAKPGGAPQGTVTPQQLGGEFVPMDKLPPDVQKRALTEK